MSTNDKELGERITTVANTLLQLIYSHDELLSLLDSVEEILRKVEQSPSVSRQNALSPLMKALVVEELMKHSNVDVKVSVASCISEITRITAPDAPYDDDIMKDVCQLIVSSFEGLSDTSSRSFDKRITILETVAKVQSCVIMLDLECDQMIIEMFQHFLKAISDNHAEVVFGSMETIMTLLLEESENISSDLLNPILATLKRNGEDVTPIAKRLAERVIQSSAHRVGPCLAQAVKSLDAYLDDFGEVVASVGRGTADTVKNSNESFSRDQPVVKRKSASASPCQDQVTQVASEGREEIVSNGIAEAGGEEIGTDVNSSEKADSDDRVDAKSMSKTESDDCSAQNTTKLEHKDGHSGAEEVACNHKVTGKEAKSLDKVEGTTTQLSPSQTPEKKAAHFDTAPENDEDSTCVSEERLKDATSKKVYEGESISIVKEQRMKGRKQSVKTTNKTGALTEEGGSKNDEGGRSDSMADTLDQMEKLGDASKKLGSASKKLRSASKKLGGASKKQVDGSSMTKDDTNKSGRLRPTIVKDALKFRAKDNVTSPWSPLMSLKDKDIREETQRMSSKKKQTPGTEKPSDTIVYDKNLIGSKVKVWWPEDRMYYEGIITSFYSAKKKHRVLYNDGDEEILYLRKERWQLVEDDSDSDGVASEGREEIVSNGIAEAGGEEIGTDVNSSGKADSDDRVDAKSMSKTESDDCSAQNTTKLEHKDGHSGAEEVACNHKVTGKEAKSLDKVEGTTTQLSPSQTPEKKAAHFDTAPENDEESTCVSEERLKDATSKKVYEGESISIVKEQRMKGRKQSVKTTNKTGALTEEGGSKNYEGSRSDYVADTLDQMEKLGDASKKLRSASKMLGGASKKLRSASKMLGGASKKQVDGSSMTKDDTNKSGRLRPTIVKDALKFRAKDNVTSPRSPLKSLKDKDIREETQRMSSKKKQTPGTEKPSDTIVYDKNLIGSKVKVWWPEDRMYYEGIITSFYSAKKKHRVLYKDGDEEILYLRKERWQLVEDDTDSDGDDGVEHSSHTSFEMKMKKKKRNANSETPKSSKRQKTDNSSKSKTNDTTTKSGGKSETKVNKNSKSSVNSSDDSDIKPRDHPRKLRGKSHGDSGKASKNDSGKSSSYSTKEDNKGSVKSKGETYSGKPHGRPPKMTRTSSSSKMKVTDSDEEILEDAVKLLTPDKGKSRGSEGKIGEKRKR